MPHFPHLYPCPPTFLPLPPPTSEWLRNVPPYACKWGCYKWWLGLMSMKGWCLAHSPAPPPPLPPPRTRVGAPSSRWQPPTGPTRSFVARSWTSMRCVNAREGGAHWFLPCLVCDRSSGTFSLMRGRHWAWGWSTSPFPPPPPSPPHPFPIPIPATSSPEAPRERRPSGKGVIMKKTRSSNLRRAWPNSELPERPLEHNLSRSEKDIRAVQKQHLPPPPHFSPSPPSYRAPGESDTPPSWSSTLLVQNYSKSPVMICSWKWLRLCCCSGSEGLGPEKNIAVEFLL